MSNVTALYSAVWLLALAFLILRQLRQYRVDALRQDLFAIRDELFDFAASGHIGFDDPAYGATRTLLNSLIRFAHKITLSRALIAVASKKIHVFVPRNPLAPVAVLPDGDLKDNLYGIYARVIHILLRHILFGAPILWIMLIGFFVKLGIEGAAKKTSDKLRTFAEDVGIDLLATIAVEIEDLGLSPSV